MIRTVVLLALLSMTADAADLSLLDDAPLSRLQRCYRRCEREHGPMPTPVPTHSPKPTPPPAPCHDSDRFSRVSANHYRKENVVLEVGVERVLCVDLPPNSFPFFELYTINKGDASCSDLAMTAIPPSGSDWLVTSGPAPVLRPNIDVGRWFVKLDLRWGCNKYDFHIRY